jgi:hypothetical protein
MHLIWMVTVAMAIAGIRVSRAIWERSGKLQRTIDEKSETTILAQSIEARVRSVRALADTGPEVSCQSHEDEEREDLECQTGY